LECLFMGRKGRVMERNEADEDQMNDSASNKIWGLGVELSALG